jgi:glycosyltransferase involved in cell wall biosynthesis
VVHSLASVNPVFAGGRSVVTLHDVIFLHQKTVGRLTSLGMGALAKVATRRADALIAGTASARDEICALLGVDPSRFTVIHHGVEPAREVVPTGAEELRARYGLSGRVVLCVAAKRPHKNQELLIRALPRLDADVQIVLAGHAEPYELELRALTSELALEDRIRFVGYVSDADLEGLWRLAACAAFPTRGEGFGMPIMEGLARGVPLAASDLPALREIGGALPHFFDPEDPASCARAIGAALGDTETAELGPRYAAGFTWEAAAQATFEVYERVLGAGPP